MDEVVELFGKYSCASMLNLNCKVLGLVISGCRYIYDSERCVEVGAGSMFLLGEGLHFVKDMPTQDGERVCIVEIEITQALMQSAIISLINDYEVENFDQFKDCDTLRSNFAVAKPSMELVVLLKVAARQCGDMVRTLRISELLYNLISDGYNSFCALMFAYCDIRRARFASQIYGNLLSHKTVNSMADLNCCSATTFKSEFKRSFDSSPHKWHINQRLRLAQTLLVTTDLRICQIGEICSFSNTSHFIRLFKQRYNLTPRIYRLRNHKKLLP